MGDTDTVVESGNLPASFTSFVGRRHEIAEIRRLLGAGRLLTLTGVGGVGKTRLALEAPRAFGKAFAGGVWLVDLASVRDPAAVTAGVAGALRMPDLGVRPVVDQLARYLTRQRALLILDNCEHLVEACADLVQALLSAEPELHIPATSRHTLGVTGEYVLAVPPLPPDVAVALLLDRAIAVHADFAVSPPRAGPKWPSSAPAWMDCRWPSSWPRPGCGASLSNSWRTGRNPGSRCSAGQADRPAPSAHSAWDDRLEL